MQIKNIVIYLILLVITYSIYKGTDIEHMTDALDNVNMKIQDTAQYKSFILSRGLEDNDESIKDFIKNVAIHNLSSLLTK